MHHGEIWDKVEAFRREHPMLDATQLPLDLITFVDLDLGLDMIPYVAMGRHTWLRDDGVRQKSCERIAPRFGVHWQTIATRLDREGLWPSIY